MPARGEIENTLSRFMNSFDLKDWASMLGLLEPIIRVDYADLRGSAPAETSAREYVRARAEALQRLHTQHLLTNLDVDASGGVASVRATCLIHRSDGTRRFDSHAFYTFSLVRRGRTWRISAIVQRILWSEGDPSLHTGASRGRARGAAPAGRPGRHAEPGTPT